MVEHAVRETGLLAVKERMGEVDIFGDADPRRHVGPSLKLVGAGPQNQLEDQFQPLDAYPAHLAPGARRRPLAVVLDVGPAEPLEELANAVERGVVAAGFSPELRPFSAHLTLGRIRGKRFPLVTGDVTSSGNNCAVKEVVLFKSELRPSGAHYTPIERAPLGGEPSPLLTETDQSIYNPKAGG